MAYCNLVIICALPWILLYMPRMYNACIITKGIIHFMIKSYLKYSKFLTTHLIRHIVVLTT